VHRLSIILFLIVFIFYVIFALVIVDLELDPDLIVR